MPIDVSRSLFIKNDAGEFVPVPMLKGEPGPAGPQGEPGSDANVTFENITNALGYIAADDEFVQEQAQEISQINESITEISNGYRLISLVENEYITTGGLIKPYIGWARTDYVEIEGDFIKISAAESSRYNCWFDSNRNYLGHFDLNVGINRIPVYYGASYFMLSSTISGMKSTKVWDETHSRLDSLENTVPEVFVAEYGVTSYAEITAAIDAGKQVQVHRLTNNMDYAYYFSRRTSTSIFFGQVETGGIMRYVNINNNDTWASGVVEKVNSISSAVSNSQYPSAKAVYDFVTDPSTVPVKSVSADGTAITPDVSGNVDVPIATTSAVGVVKPNPNFGLAMHTGAGYEGTIRTQYATESEITARGQFYKPIVPKTFDYAVKAALTDGKGAAYTAEEKAAARSRIGLDKKFVTIEEVIVSGDVDEFTKSAEPNGQPYSFERLAVKIKVPAKSAANNGYMVFRVTLDEKLNTYISVALVNNYIATTERYCFFTAEIEGGRLFGRSMASGATSESNGQTLHSMGGGMGIYEGSAITKFSINKGSTNIPDGSIITISAIRA